jgi:ABC-2 type transport system ATP-binding protein
MDPGMLTAVLDGVIKRYGAKIALDGIRLSIERGTVTALLGPNGAGKSTAIALLLGLTTPDSGTVSLLGESPKLLSARRRIGVMLQSAALPETLRVRELLQLTAAYYPSPLPLAETAAMAGIDNLMRRSYGALSGGEQRKVQFALAICGNPELMFLDEPTTGLDIQARETVWSVIRAFVRKGCGVLLTTHYLEEAEALAQRVVVLMDGRIVSEGTMDALRAQSAERWIRCLSTVAAETICEWPEVRRVTRKEQWLEIESGAAESVLRRLLAADPALRDLEVRRAGLAEALLHITKEAARPRSAGALPFGIPVVN